MKDFEQNCTDIFCAYYDERMESNCSYSEDNTKCIKNGMNKKLIQAYDEAVKDFQNNQLPWNSDNCFLEGFMLGLKEAISILEEQEAGDD